MSVYTLGLSRDPHRSDVRMAVIMMRRTNRLLHLQAFSGCLSGNCHAKGSLAVVVSCSQNELDNYLRMIFVSRMLRIVPIGVSVFQYLLVLLAQFFVLLALMALSTTSAVPAALALLKLVSSRITSCVNTYLYTCACLGGIFSRDRTL